jgi:hypothetical protein
MIEIRPILESDYEQARALHESMSLGYKLDSSQSDFIVKNGLFEDGKLISVMLGRLTAEAFLLLDRGWRLPQDRWDAVRRLAAVSAAEAKLCGVNDVHIWLPPKAGCFEGRLRRMGFVDCPWKSMTVNI